MTPELDKKLCDKYPDIFKLRNAGSPMQFPMARGITCGDGWYELLDKLCHQLTVIKEASSLQVVALQVKEKFGGLRFYTSVEPLDETEQKDVWMSVIDAVKRQAMSKSENTCESCGEFGCSFFLKDGWLVTRCKKCMRRDYPEHFERVVSNL